MWEQAASRGACTSLAYCLQNQGRTGAGNLRLWHGQGGVCSCPILAVPRSAATKRPFNVLHSAPFLSWNRTAHTHKQSKSDTEWDFSPWAQRCCCTSCSTRLGQSGHVLLRLGGGTTRKQSSNENTNPAPKQRNPHSKNKPHSSRRERKKPRGQRGRELLSWND